MSRDDWEELTGYQCPAFLRVKDTRLPYCNNCQSFNSEDLSEFHVALNGEGGISLLCVQCVEQASSRPHYRIVNTHQG